MINGAVIDTIDVELSTDNEIYQSQAASLHLLNNQTPKGEVKGIESIERSGNEYVCIAPQIPGLNGRFKLRAELFQQRCGSIDTGSFRDSVRNYMYVVKSVESGAAPVKPLKLEIITDGDN